ncbi:hypothetical protein V2J09_021308 [Rumex salicifolius]
MGQKINPLGFRLGTSQSHYSIWFAQPKNYSEGLQEDQKIRDSIKNYAQQNMRTSSGVEGIARIEIQKRIDLIKVIIYMGFPKLLIENRPRGIEELQMNVQKELNFVNRKLNIAITRIAKPYRHPNILAEFIAGQLKNRLLNELNRLIQKEFKYKLQDVSTEKKLHVSNGSERVEFPDKPFAPKLIIVPIRMKGISYRGNRICFDRYALQALEPAWITSR